MGPFACMTVCMCRRQGCEFANVCYSFKQKPGI